MNRIASFPGTGITRELANDFVSAVRKKAEQLRNPHSRRVHMEMLRDNILVLPDPPPDTSEGGIHLPDSAKHNGPTEWATVMEVGPGEPKFHKTREEAAVHAMPVRKGDRVLIHGQSGIEHGSERIMQLRHIIAIED